IKKFDFLNRTFLLLKIRNYINSEKYHTVYHLYEDEEKRKLTDILEIHFVELLKYLEKRPGLNNSLNKWLAFLTKPERKVLEVAEMAEPAIKKAITVLDMLSRDPDTVRLAELRMKQILDERSMVEGAKEEGIKEGIIKTAKSALKKGADISFVVAITGLSEEEVKKLKDELRLG
ncbi:MAG TPA: Rpn family recombination-promoting nuclease/putative transposase, partial [Clostridia bacterium]